ncbi:hypothetical protein ABZ342_29120 [Amycolatopsis sp. NPDC005961]|uniref:hypothetical protein n=1 Tax=Amycolatopsis sp. NPDC005961 TaxID=3156720 RepID=UPI003410AD42
MPTLTELPQWTVCASGDEATFTHVVTRRDRRRHYAPRVWDDRGLALHEDDLPGLAKALGEVMKLPVYWLARSRRRDVLDAGDAVVWSVPRFEADDEFVYIAGPCRTDQRAAGYRPVSAFVVDLVQLRGLRIRIAAYLAGGNVATTGA